jgi:hypothetical protein
MVAAASEAGMVQKLGVKQIPVFPKNSPGERHRSTKREEGRAIKNVDKKKNRGVRLLSALFGIFFRDSPVRWWS